jgi:RNA polymerase sigma-70 factor, ECF subfamily
MGRTSADSELSDEEVMRQLAGGDGDALGVLHRRYAARVRALAAHSLDGATAEDIVQDVFIAVWRHARTYDSERGRVRPWLFQIAHHRILNELRARSHRPTIEADAERADLSQVPSAAPGPEEAAWREEQEATVRAAVQALPVAQREALQLAFFDGLNHREVASTLRVPLGTAKTRLRAGLLRLRTTLAPVAAALVIGVFGASILLSLLQQREHAARTLDDQALALLTNSEVAMIRLVAAPGAPPAAHGSYRGRAGSEIAVVGLSHLPALGPGQHYDVWIRDGAAWRRLGTASPDATGHAYLVARGEALRTMPTAVIVTREIGAHAGTPGGIRMLTSVETGR